MIPSLPFLLYIALTFTPAGAVAWAGAVLLAAERASIRRGMLLFFLACLLLPGYWAVFIVTVPTALALPAHAGLSVIAAVAVWGVLWIRHRSAERFWTALTGWRPPTGARHDWVQDGAIAALLSAGASVLATAALATKAPDSPLFAGADLSWRCAESGFAAGFAGFLGGFFYSRRTGSPPAGSWVTAAVGLGCGLALAILGFFAAALLPALPEIHLPSVERDFVEYLSLPGMKWPALLFATTPFFGAAWLAARRQGGLRALAARAAACVTLVPAAVTPFVLISGDAKQVTRAFGQEWMQSGNAAVRSAGALLVRVALDPADPFADEGLAALAENAAERGDPASAREPLQRTIDWFSEDLAHQECVAGARASLAALGTQPELPVLISPMPAVSPADYLDPGWRALLSVIRHYEPAEPEERIQSRLTALSTESGATKLERLYEFAHIADAAERLQYRAFLGFFDKEKLLTLVRSGVPVLAWFLRGSPHEGWGGPYHTTSSQNGPWSELSPHALVVVGYVPATDVVLCYDYTLPGADHLKSATAEARSIVYGGAERRADSFPLERRVLRRIPWGTFDTRWAEAWRSAAVIVPPAHAREVLAKLKWKVREADLSTRGLRAFLRSRFYLRAGDWTEALRWGREAQRLLPGQSFPALYNAILVRRLFEEASHADEPAVFGSSVEQWRRVVREGLADRASVPAETRQLEDALQHDRLGLFLGCHLLSLVDWAVDRGDAWARSIQVPLCESLCRATPVNRYYRLRLVEASRDQGDWETAAHELMSLVDLYPGDADGRLRLGETLCALDRTEEAVRQLPDVAWWSGVGDAGFRYLQGQRARLSGRSRTARQAFADAVRRDPLEPRYSLALAEAEHDAAEDESARRELEWVRRVDPSGPFAREASRKEQRWWPR